MRIHRFYTKTDINSKNFDITDRDLIHQWKTVFRYNVGSQVIIFNGSGVDYLCMISSLRNLGASLAVIREIKKENEAPKRNLVLCMALVKKDNFELIVQKATEIGVNTIIPILCEHSEKKKINMDRLLKIAVEASEQSGRGDIPKIEQPTTLDGLFNTGILPQEKIVFHLEGMSFKDYRNNYNHPSVVAFIGPEGGFSQKEINFFQTDNVKVVTLGSQVLRAETAAIAVASLLLL